jgi:hypothetical protein
MERAGSRAAVGVKRRWLFYRSDLNSWIVGIPYK